MRALGPLIVAFALLAPCDAGAQPGGPLETALKFLEARQAFRCRDVWPLYSAGTQENIRAEVHRRERSREGLPLGEKPEEQYCANSGKWKRGSARLVRQQGNEAVVAAEFYLQSSRYDIFPRFDAQPQEIKLIHEGGAWRVDLPRIRIERPRGLEEVGPVDVTYVPSGNLGRDRLEATVVTRTARGSLIAVARDPILWARAIPSVTSVQPLERSGDRELVRLTFAGADRAITVAVRFSDPKDDPNARQTAVLWEAEGGDKAPVYLRGSWRLTPYSTGGMRVSLVLFFDSRQWPGNPATEIFSAERMAQAVLGLGK